MKRNKLLILLVLIFLINTLIIFFIAGRLSLKDVQTLDMDMEVKNKIGFNVDTDKIHFGGLPPGGMSEREIVISHDFDFPVKVSIKTSGELAEYVTVSDNNFILSPLESKKITFYAIIDEDVPLGNYTGNARFEFRRPSLFN